MAKQEIPRDVAEVVMQALRSGVKVNGHSSWKSFATEARRRMMKGVDGNIFLEEARSSAQRALGPPLSSLVS